MISYYPVHHRSATNEDRHWSIVGIFLQQKMSCHCDSLHRLVPEVHSIIYSFIGYMGRHCGNKVKVEEWVFTSPNDIHVQTNGYDCGVFTCINGYIQ